MTPCVLYLKITNKNDNYLLQTDLDRISNWCSTWLMTLNPTKCKSTKISRSCNCSELFDYNVNGTKLEDISIYKLNTLVFI